MPFLESENTRISGVLTVPLRSERRTARKRAFAPRTRRRRPSGSRTSAWCWSRFARARLRTTRAPRSPTRRPQTTSIAPAGAGPGEASPQRARPRRAQARRGTPQRRRVLRHFGAGPGAAGASRRTGRRSPRSTTKGGTATWAIYDIASSPVRVNGCPTRARRAAARRRADWTGRSLARG